MTSQIWLARSRTNTINQTSKIFNLRIDTFNVNMINSINRYYQYRSFDGSIKIKVVFLEEVGHFFIAIAKNGENQANFYNSLID
jgi:hypothetical protein